MGKSEIKFFLGSNTPQGFFSLFDELYATDGTGFAYIIKGGPGTGKSSFMRAVAEQLSDLQLNEEYIYCSSDPNSLDAIIFHGANACVADGTAPHVLNAKFPGAVDELVNLGDFWNKNELFERRNEIIALTQKNTSLHKRCFRFLEAAGSLGEDARRLASGCVDGRKVDRYASRLAAKELPQPNGKIGREKTRFLSALTPEGVFVHTETMEALCKKIIVIEDEYSVAAPALLAQLRRYALGNGLEVISCLCPLNPEGPPEHLIIPEIGLGFFTSNKFHPAEFKDSKTVRASRFINSDEIKKIRGRLSFTKRAQTELLEEAMSAQERAKQIHDELEKLYIPTMNFEGVHEKAKEVAQLIRARRA